MLQILFIILRADDIEITAFILNIRWSAFLKSTSINKPNFTVRCSVFMISVKEDPT
jgi:hypothetical protein